jgi:8-oxo-dGTP diphosphatase
MITLNTDNVTIEITDGVFDEDLPLTLRDLDKTIGSVRVSHDNKATAHISLNVGDETSFSLKEETILSLSQYLLHRQSTKTIVIENDQIEVAFSDVQNRISLDSIYSFATNLPVVQVAIVVLKNADGFLLLGYRPQGKFMPHLWEFPGGKLEPGESPTDAGRREIEEELGIIINEPKESSLFLYCFTKNRLEGHVMFASEWTGQPTALHHQEIRWVAPADLYTYPMPLSNILFPHIFQNN